MADYNEHGGVRSPFPPLEPTELAKEAEKFEWNPVIPLKYYVGALDALYREGRNYLRERNFAKAYLLLFRFSILYLDRVTTLPEAQTAAGRELLRPTKKRIRGVLAELERIKPDLEEARNRWEAERQTVPAGYPSSSFAARDAALSWNAKAQARLLDVSDHQDLAVDLATQELRRRDAARKATRQAGISAEEEQRRRTAGVWDDWDRPASSAAAVVSESELIQQQMEQARRRLDRREDDDSQPDAQDGPAPVAYHYPSISKSKPLQYDLSQGELQHELPSRPQRPPRPPRELPMPLASHFDAAPPLPPRQELLSSHDTGNYEFANDHPSSEIRPPARPPKTVVEAAPEKERFTFRPAAYLEDGKPIRPIFLPENLRRDFVRLAASNTKLGIETCGILCGTNINNALFITCLLIPEQHGTPDTCETTNEAATFDFFEKEDLLQIGWIHTHPTQTCFMSSRDLHTQAGYQIMMDESIAIVCAPSHDPSWGIFRLTKPPGLQHLLNCEQTNTFHQHSLPADALYTNAKNPPGHVFVTSRMDYWVHDLRKGS